jgi:hypothetical protein
MTHHASFPRTLVLCAVTAIALHGGARPLAAQSVEQQVELSVLLLEVSVDEWGERNAVPAADGADDQVRSAALAAVEKKFNTERARLYESYFTSASQHFAFFGEHAADVEQHLSDHPEVKARIDALNRALHSSIAVDESKGSANAGVPQ